MNIEVGKFYRNCHNQKVEVVRLFESRIGPSLLGIYTYIDGGTFGGWDLISTASEKWTPWIDEPAIPWDSVPDWCQWWVVDADGDQKFFSEEPVNVGLFWVRKTDKKGFVLIPDTHRIPYVGDWRESLRQRPGKEESK